MQVLAVITRSPRVAQFSIGVISEAQPKNLSRKISHCVRNDKQVAENTYVQALKQSRGEARTQEFRVSRFEFNPKPRTRNRKQRKRIFFNSLLRLGQDLLDPFDHFGRLVHGCLDGFLQLLAGHMRNSVPIDQVFRLGGEFFVLEHFEKSLAQ